MLESGGKKIDIKKASTGITSLPDFAVLDLSISLPGEKAKKATSKLSALMLIFLMIFSPVHQVFADEGEVAVVEPEPVTESAAEVNAEASPEPQLAEVLESSSPTPEPEANPISETLENDLGNIQDEAEDSVQGEDVLETATDEVSEEADSEPAIEEAVNTDNEEAEEAAATEEEGSEAPTPTPSANSGSGGGVITEEEGQEDTETESEEAEVVENSNNESGGDADLVRIRQEVLQDILKEMNASSLEDLKNKLNSAENNLLAENIDSENPDRDSASLDVFSAKDDSGDKEIYLKNGADTIQITENEREDDFVSWDLGKKFLVWQSLIGGRWQIFFYDVVNEKEYQITDTNFNNVNPAVQGNVAVWQGWVEDNWEIFIGQKEGQSWQVKQLTDNYYHDMFPKILGNLIVWQNFYKNNWQVFMYDLITEEIRQVSVGEAINENPRLAVIWDAKTEEGDIKSMAYDIISGQSITLNPGNSDQDKLPELPSLPSASNDLSIISMPGGVASKSGNEEGGEDSNGNDQEF